MEDSRESLSRALLWAFLLIAFAVFVISFYHKNANEKEMKKIKEIIASFNNKEDLICGNFTNIKIVSKLKGYHFDKKNKNFITNEDDIFHISFCRKR